MTSAEDFFSFTIDHWVQAADDAHQMERAPSKKCRVCRDPSILGLVNKMLALGFTAPDIGDTLESHNLKLRREGKPEITENCIKNHRSRHFDAQVPSAVVLRRLQEENAKRRSAENIEDAVGTLLNARTYHQTMMIKGYQALMDPQGVISPELGGKSAVWLYEQDLKEEEGRDMAHMQAEFGRMIEVIRNYVPADKWTEVQAVLRGEAIEHARPKSVGAVRMVEIDDTESDA